MALDDVAPEILFREGVLGRCRPAPRDDDDIVLALKVIAALGPFDVGQAVIVADNHVLAVEAAEGTDNMLDPRRRTAQATAGDKPAGQRRSGEGAKARSGPPLRSAGDRSANRRKCARAGLAGLAVAAGSTIIAEIADVIAAADRAKIFLVGVAEGPGP